MAKKEFENTVSIIADATVINNNSISLKIEVDNVTAVELKVGEEELTNRKAVYIETLAENENNILIGYGDIVLSDLNAGMELAPASKIELALDGDISTKLQALADGGGTNYIRITEIK